MRAVAVRVGRSTGAVDARMDDYSDSIEIYPQRRYFIHPTGDESTRGGSAARIGKDAKTTAIMGEK
jgi:hypothetical protein